MSSEQRSLFSAAELQSARYGQPIEPLAISQSALRNWKQRVNRFQQQVIVSLAGEQGSLFGLSPSAEAIAAEVNPFTLPRQNAEFWRWQVDDVGVAAFYFVIDYQLPILLYVGETVKANQRWKGEHDCKRYIENYISVHRRCGEENTVGIAFLHWAPTETRSRQQLESALIYQWRSPFNKQNWTFWGTPFVGGK
ncbi:MAG: GIY-YIG nuclease family protein [Oscillatoriales cyanobacterium C42_A2020_001]|nr:GIY-YIG nuclease family protein [Leptolyngbyaceae cyanobacterium C42_A2020_001]